MGLIRNALLVSTSLAFLGFASFGAHANLVTDPGFEAGGSGWTFVGNAGPDNHDFTHSGEWTSFVNSIPVFPGSDSGAIIQNITTTPGDNYSIDLWAARNAFTNSSSEIVISFGGTTLFDEINPPFNIVTCCGGGPPPGPNPGEYTELSFTALASTTLSTFEYQGLNLTGGTYFLDDVSINDLTSPTPTPEPATLGLLVAALVGFGALLRCGRRFSVEALSLQRSGPRT